MRVLWFSNSPSRYYAQGSGKGYNGCGWISSLEALVREDVTLGIVFLTASKADAPRRIDGVDYYPVYDPSDNRRARVKKLLFGHGCADKYLVGKYLEVVDSFCPDVIQVFGSEHSFGLVAGKVSCPVFLHVQGIMGPYYKAFLIPGLTWRKYIFWDGTLQGALLRLYIRSRWRHAVRREKKILSLVQNYFCRTAWDKAEILKANPSAHIIHCDEVLRPAFYDAAPWQPEGDKPVFVTTISEPSYKGFDVVLRAGKMLKDSGLDFEWRVFGNVAPAFFEMITGVTCSQAGVTLRCVADADTLAEELRRAWVYVHPSYIENSPNSVCEAQMIGVPVVAADVGGVSSLIDDGQTGYLFPAGDASALASKLRDPSRASSKSVAYRRHNKEKIKSTILTAWRESVNI